MGDDKDGNGGDPIWCMKGGGREGGGGGGELSTGENTSVGLGTPAPQGGVVWLWVVAGQGVA